MAQVVALAEVDLICGLCDMEISSLLQLMEQRDGRLQALTASQEREIADDIGLLGMLCQSSNAEFRRKMERLAREFDLLNREDTSQPFDERRGYTAVIALRDWHYKGFASLRTDRS